MGWYPIFSKSRTAPLTHPAVDEIRAGYRRAPYYANSVYYRIEGDRIAVARILGRQDPSKAF
jgi:toxin ParE1/3/4